jgi:hypothetical protein
VRERSKVKVVSSTGRMFPKPLLAKEMVVNTIPKEVRIRFFRTFICFSLTWYKGGIHNARCQNISFYNTHTNYVMVRIFGWLIDRNQSFFPNALIFIFSIFIQWRSNWHTTTI